MRGRMVAQFKGSYSLSLPQLWSTESGKCFHTFRGHAGEIVCLGFNPSSTLVATGSMDTTAKLWSVETGIEQCTLTVSWGEEEWGRGEERGWGEGRGREGVGERSGGREEGKKGSILSEDLVVSLCTHRATLQK